MEKWKVRAVKMREKMCVSFSGWSGSYSNKDHMSTCWLDAKSGDKEPLGLCCPKAAAGLTRDQCLISAKELKLFEINIVDSFLKGWIWILSGTMLDKVLIFLSFPFERAVLKYFSCQIFLQLYCTTERCTFGVLHDISKLDVYFWIQVIFMGLTYHTARM